MSPQVSLPQHYRHGEQTSPWDGGGGRGRCVHYGTSDSILGLHPVDTSSIPKLTITKNVSKYCQISYGGKVTPG